MNRQSKIVAGRPVDGITLNGELEFVLDEEGGVRVFESMKKARRYLRKAGCTAEEMRGIRDAIRNRADQSVMGESGGTGNEVS